MTHWGDKHNKSLREVFRVDGAHPKKQKNTNINTVRANLQEESFLRCNTHLASLEMIGRKRAKLKLPIMPCRVQARLSQLMFVNVAGTTFLFSGFLGSLY